MSAIQAANPISTERVHATLDEAALELAMSEAIARGRVLEQAMQPLEQATRPGEQDVDRTASSVRLRSGRAFRRGRARFGLVAVVVVAAALAVAIVVIGGISGDGGRPQFAAAAVEVAESNPRLLVSRPGWEVVRADEFMPDTGEITFSDGRRRLDLRWYPAHLYRRYLHDRSFVSAPERGTLLGQDSTTVHYGRGEFATMLSPQGDVFIEIRGQLGSRRAYDRVLRSLQPVDVDTWLAAMPPTSVRPEARAAVVEEMLRGIPLPPGFDPTQLQDKPQVSDRFQLAASVAGSVACGWIESWLAAKRSGDLAAAARAADAMSTWRSWPVVNGINPAAWPANLRTFSRQLRKGALSRGPAGYEVRPDGTTYAVGPAYAAAFGCGGLYHRPVPTPAR